MIAYDLDGVVAKTVLGWKTLNKLRRFLPKPIFWGLLRFASLLAPVGFSPLPGSIIITGRSYRDKKITELWMKLHGIDTKVYYSPAEEYDEEIALRHKISAINTLLPDVYIEDDIEVAKILHERCPNTIICVLRDNKAKSVAVLLEEGKL